MKSIIITENLTKQYGQKQVVQELDLRVPSGSIYGFLGPNGAGKSTTMKMILGLVKPTRGTIHVFGKEVKEKNRLALLASTGSLIESPSYYGHLSGKENLQIICTLKNVPFQDIDRVLTVVRMKEQQHKKVSQYSLGMKQRLGLACALLGSPRLLLLDEPTNGLDPAGIQEMRELICTLPKHYGITVLVSSHLLSEIDQMATHVGIIDHGELIFQDSLSSLHEHSRSHIRLLTTDDQRACRLLIRQGLPVKLWNQTLCLNSTEDALVLKAGTLLLQEGIGILRLEEVQKSLEDIFLQLTGRQVSL